MGDRKWGIGSGLGVAVVVAFQLGTLVRPSLLYTVKRGYEGSAKGSWLQCRRGKRREEVAAALPCP